MELFGLQIAITVIYTDRCFHKKRKIVLFDEKNNKYVFN